MLGAILVPVGFEEATRYIPTFGPPGLVDDLQWVAIGAIVVFSGSGRKGCCPSAPEDRRRRAPKPIEIPNEDVVTLAGSLRAPGWLMRRATMDPLPAPPGAHHPFGTFCC